jgi:hypothetical protein
MAQDATLQKVLDALGDAVIYEVDVVGVGAATAGTIILSFVWDGITWTTGSIAYNAAASTVQSAIQAATGPAGQTLPANIVTATGGPLATTSVTVTFQGQMVGPITGQTNTPSGLTGGTATFTRSINGVFSTLISNLQTLSSAIALDGAAAMPSAGFPLMLRGSDGKPAWPAVIASGDGIAQLGVYMEGGSAQGTRGSTPGTGMLQVGFYDVNGHINSPNLDAAGALTLQSSGADGSPVPAKTMAIGGTDGTNLQTLAVNTSGALLVQGVAAPGTAAPAVVEIIGGTDNNGNAQGAAISAQGALATMDAGAVPLAPLSINGTAFTYGQTGAVSGPITVTTSSSTILPDSSGGSAINGLRGQVEIVNVGNTDISISPSLATVWGAVWVLRPGGSLITTYAGPISAISNNTNGGISVGSPSNLLSVVEWA